MCSSKGILSERVESIPLVQVCAQPTGGIFFTLGTIIRGRIKWGTIVQIATCPGNELLVWKAFARVAFRAPIHKWPLSRYGTCIHLLVLSTVGTGTSTGTCTVYGTLVVPYGNEDSVLRSTSINYTIDRTPYRL